MVEPNGLLVNSMAVIDMTTLAAPQSFIESVSHLRSPTRADSRLTVLMDRHNEGLLDQDEVAELESLVEVSETLSLLCAETLLVLGRHPE